MAGDKPNPTQRPAPARGPGGGALQQRKRPARTCVPASFDVAATASRATRCGDVASMASEAVARGRTSRPPYAIDAHAFPTQGERRPAPSTAARHPALLRRGDAGPQDWSDDRTAAASLSSQFIHGRIDGVRRRRDTHATPAQVLVMSVMFVGFVVLLHIYGKLTAVPDAVDEDPILPETPGADA